MSWGGFDGRLYANRQKDTYLHGLLDVSGRLFVTKGDVSFNGNLFIGYDASINGNATISGNLTVNGNLTAVKIANKYIVNTTTSNYQLIVTEDLSLNGRLFVGGKVGIGSTDPKNTLDVNGGMALTNNNFTGTVSPNGNSANGTTITYSMNAPFITTQWLNDGIYWSAETSTVVSNNLPSTSLVRYPQNAFNNIFNAGSDLTNFWMPSAPTYDNNNGTYTGTLNTTLINTPTNITASGEWIQINSSVPVVMKNYTLYTGNILERNPKKYYIAGSNDGTTWYPIIYVTMNANAASANSSCGTITIPSEIYAATAANNVNTTGVTFSYNYTTYMGSVTSYSSRSYTKFRLIITDNWANGTNSTFVALSEWNINFKPVQYTNLAMDSTNYNHLNINSALSLNSLCSSIYSPNSTAATGDVWATSDSTLWIASASSVYTYTTTVYPAYKAFNASTDIANNNSWASNNAAANLYSNGGAYPTTGATGTSNINGISGITSLSGEWIQIYCTNFPLILSDYRLAAADRNQFPKIYYLLGSNDNTNWYGIHKGETVNFNTSGTTSTYEMIITQQGVAYSGYGGANATLNTTVYSGGATNAYRYFRMVITQIQSTGNSNVAQLAEWNINFKGPKKNILSLTGCPVGFNGKPETTTQTMIHMTRGPTQEVQCTTTAEIRLGSVDSILLSTSKLDFQLSNTASGYNTFGSVADNTVMTLLGNGKVGIGTTNPSVALDIQTATGNAPLNVKVGDANALRVTNAGKVAINTSASYVWPLTILANTNTTTGGNLICNSTSSSGGLGDFQGRAPFVILDNLYNNGIGIGLKMGIWRDSGSAYIQCEGANTGYKNICMQTYGGNVGIGTTNPQATLDVLGGMSLANNFSGNTIEYTPNSSVNAKDFTWTNNGIIWTSTASSELAGDYQSYRLYNPGEYGWSSNAGYTNGNANTTTGSPKTSFKTTEGGIPIEVYGQYVQLRSSAPLVIKNYSFSTANNSQPAPNIPREFYILGSNDGTTWYAIQQGTVTNSGATVSNSTASAVITVNQTYSSNTQSFYQVSAGTSRINTTTYGSYTTAAYTYFRILINKTIGTNNNNVYLSDITLKFTNSIITSSNLSMDTSNYNQLNVNSIINSPFAIQSGQADNGYYKEYLGKITNYSATIGPLGYTSQPYIYWKDGTTRYYWTAPANGALLTGQHLVVADDPEIKTNLTEYVGLIVSSNDTGHTSYYNNVKYTGIDAIRICEALPNCKLSTIDNDKAVFGVITNQENDKYFDPDGQPIYDNVDNGFEKSLFDRIRVNSVGEGSIWVTNINGNIENGDYITSSIIPGYGKRQDDDLLHNYTVGKSTMSCDFDINSTRYKTKIIDFNGNTYIAAFIGCTYHCG